ncbi:phage virion morphogenesis protein [Pararhodospirillum photometricum]|uniref:phage virion morphogenesis protein n=1 Tax=Pararhodospirillum photometricum TaxID=1084 RepID=UPI0005A1CC9A|nr:phage virion morphogenesis protein [Pararhodospirillum photometricum]
MTTTDDPTAIERFLLQSLARLQPSERKKLLKSLATELRRRNRQRMGKQVGPDGTPWVPRARELGGTVRRIGRMMSGLKEVRRMSIRSTADEARVGWGARNARIAQVHQEGGPDRVSPRGPRITYVARPLLGLPPDDVQWVRHRLLDYFSGELT